MSNSHGTKNQWEAYLEQLNVYVGELTTWVASYDESGENPDPPRPVKPPQIVEPATE